LEWPIGDCERSDGERGHQKGQQGFFPCLELPGFPVGKPVRKALILGERPEDLSTYLSALAASLGFKVLVADGANAFDPYLVSKFARRGGLPPEGLLKEILVARAFTCHQLVTLIRERLEPMIPSGASPLVVLLGPCTMFFDQDVSEKEATLLFRRMLARIEEMSERGVFFLMGQSLSGCNRRRGFLLRDLARSSDAVFRLKSSPDALQLALEKPPLAMLRRWEAFEQFKSIT